MHYTKEWTFITFIDPSSPSNNENSSNEENDTEPEKTDTEGCWYYKQYGKHDWDPNEYHLYDNEYKKCDATYHYRKYYCNYCSEIKWAKEKHNTYGGGRIIRTASIYSNGIDENICNACNYKWRVSYKWEYTSYDEAGYCYYSYDIYKHTPVDKNSKNITVYLSRPAKGSILKVTIGKKTYSKKIANNSKKFNIKIKKSSYGKTVKIRLYYKNKLIGKDYCATGDNYLIDRVCYSKKIRKGMSKNQVKYTYGWGSPYNTGSSSGGWNYWYYRNGSYVAFKKGKVFYWYKVN